MGDWRLSSRHEFGAQKPAVVHGQMHCRCGDCVLAGASISVSGNHLAVGVGDTRADAGQRGSGPAGRDPDWREFAGQCHKLAVHVGRGREFYHAVRGIGANDCAVCSVPIDGGQPLGAGGRGDHYAARTGGSSVGCRREAGSFSHRRMHTRIGDNTCISSPFDRSAGSARDGSV